MKKYVFTLLTLLTMAGLWWLSSLSSPIKNSPFFGFDKVVHFCAYGVLAAVAFGAMRERGLSLKWAFIGAFLLGTLYGGIDEIHQSFVPTRECSIYDFSADMLGSAAAALALLLITKRNAYSGNRHRH